MASKSIADQLSPKFGQPVLVESHPGGLIATVTALVENIINDMPKALCTNYAVKLK